MRQTLLYSMIVVNTAIVASLALVSFTLVLICVQALIVAACIFLAYQGIRRKDGSFQRDLLLIASVFSFPLFVVPVSFVIALFIPERSSLSDLVSLLVLNAYYWVPTYIGITYLLFAAASLGVAWRYGASLIRHKVVLSLYTIMQVLYIGYVVWWYATGQEHTYL